MKKHFPITTALIAIGFVGAAHAADLPNVKGPPVFAPPPPAFSWTGVYVGVNAGWVSLYDHGDPFCVTPAGVLNGTGCDTTNVPGAHTNANGFLGGAQIGYNWQVSQFVFGLETDFQGAELKGSVYVAGPFAEVGGGTSGPASFTADERLSWLGTARGRVGFLIMPNLLLYGTGGLAYGEVSVDQNTIFPGLQYPSSTSGTRAGWTVGGGFEYAIDPHWSVKFEALYYDLGSISTSGGPVPPSPPPVYLGGKTFDIDGAIVRAGVNYKFDLFAPPAPVVAKY
jgi:outer membrane immunogenic protein